MSEHALESVYLQLIEQLKEKIDPQRIITESAKRLAYGTDASFYRLTPKVVLQLSNIDEVILAINCCRDLGIHFTFRAAGTSLSGQALSDSVLITLTDDWRGHSILNNGEQITLQPGVIGADANRYLLPYQRKIGPDPASINTCKIGGIAANNASGMCCGTAQNSYQTVANMKLVFVDGCYLDTSDPESVAQFKHEKAELLDSLQQLAANTLNNKTLAEQIRHKYRLKNTTGYSLNALVDFDDPIEILKHLMIGSEGTLGFIAEVTYNTVEELPNKASALLVFPTIEQASQAVTTLSTTPVAAVELMDGRSLASVAGEPGMPSFIESLDANATALLVEVHAHCNSSLTTRCDEVLTSIADFSILESIPFTSDAQVVSSLWAIRKGLFPAVGAVREVGTTVIIEDVAFPVEYLANGINELQQLFDKYHYDEAIIFGHALEGNLHFVFTQAFDTPTEVKRYEQFMEDVAQLVAVKYQGSLKAEHGTGRNMAPFVELEWGKEGYQLMQQIKRIFDPQGLINPDVIISSNPNTHIENLKPMPAANDIVDRCIECGFCEPVCPSRTLTLSPRQRIVLYREIKRRERELSPIDAKALKEVFEYQGLDTCAATGLCADRCPVGINTGDLVKDLRTAKYKRFTPIAQWTATQFATTSSLVRSALNVNQSLTKHLGTERLQSSFDTLTKWTGGRTPTWYPETPLANNHRPKTQLKNESQQTETVVYVPSCASRTMGSQNGSDEHRSLTEVTLSLLAKANVNVIIPDQIDQTCCGMPYESKGMKDIAEQKRAHLEQLLWDSSNHGAFPILMDTSPCVKRTIENSTHPLSIEEPTNFILNHLLDRLSIEQKQETVMLHVTCSSRRMGLEANMLKLAQLCASEVVVPEHISCCGWAGDKGFTTPELNASALDTLQAQVPENCTRGFSNSRTCEIGLSHHSGVPYQSILYLVDEVSTPL
ncbi:FAD-binding and (Fe-S)-binding domain-containing protein [Vibrio maerlii]|uniref:FAD-binding and (Fe-S)-binding domain-containing protein n=1 Tax=Vibrio maerlii TaxID=2231648 RepID=UPI000E3D4F47|nr:FAD-binding and (Fe-S)-binding domain-containing protein [Vibrio maerlii]